MGSYSYTPALRCESIATTVAVLQWTKRTNQMEYITDKPFNHHSYGFIVHKQPSTSGSLWAINPWLRGQVNVVVGVILCACVLV